MTRLRADLTGLADLVSRLDSFESRAASLVAELEVQGRRLEGGWNGSAAAAHAAAHREWIEGATRMRSAARALRTAVATAHANYALAVSANARMWS